MAIGTVAAIGLGVAGVGSAISSSNAKKAANKATDASLAAQRENNALSREIYGKNEGYLSPSISRGNDAGNQINALLGLPTYTTAPTPAPANDPRMGLVNSGGFGRGFNTMMGIADAAQQQPATTTTRTITQPGGQQAAFDTFRQGLGYDFTFNEGMRALDARYAGASDSGAARKDYMRFGQGLATQNALSPYFNLLSQQQGVGLSAGSALAGVGQNYAASVSANNNNAASTIGNAALYKANNDPFANALGIIGGGLFGSSFGK